MGLSRKALRKGHIKKSFSSTYKIHVVFNEGGDSSFLNHTPPPELPPSLPKYLIAFQPGQPAFLESDLEDMSKIDIIDFGSSFESGIQERQLGATFSYASPELQIQSIAAASRESDLWSLGILVCIYPLYP